MKSLLLLFLTLTLWMQPLQAGKNAKSGEVKDQILASPKKNIRKSRTELANLKIKFIQLKTGVESGKYPLYFGSDKERLNEVAQELGLTKEQVLTWGNNYRGRNDKTKKIDQAARKIFISWLIKNLDFPVPNPATIETLSEQTGQSYSQVDNWYTNARGRYFDKSEDGDFSLKKDITFDDISQEEIAAMRKARRNKNQSLPRPSEMVLRPRMSVDEIEARQDLPRPSQMVLRPRKKVCEIEARQGLPANFFAPVNKVWVNEAGQLRDNLRIITRTNPLLSPETEVVISEGHYSKPDVTMEVGDQCEHESVQFANFIWDNM